MAVEDLATVTVDDIPDLDEDDLFYLLQRSKFADEVVAELESRDIDPYYNANPVHQLQRTPNFGNANTTGQAPPPTREDGEDDPSYLEKFETREENLTAPQLVGMDDDDEDDGKGFEIPEGDPDKSWTNDQLRAELQRLADEGGYDADLDGKKDELIARVEEKRAAASA